MSKKVPYLETSPETYQQKDGSGSCNTGYPTPTGKRTAAILQAPKDSSLPTETPLSTPLDATWGDAVQADLDQAREEAVENFPNGKVVSYRGYDIYLPNSVKPEKRDAFLEHEVQRLHDLTLRSLGNGGRGVSDLELLQFWEQRIPVRQKG